jgi:hypothetical protein
VSYPAPFASLKGAIYNTINSFITANELIESTSQYPKMKTVLEKEKRGYVFLKILGGQ